MILFSAAGKAESRLDPNAFPRHFVAKCFGMGKCLEKSDDKSIFLFIFSRPMDVKMGTKSLNPNGE